MGANGRQRLESAFSVGRMIQGYRQVYSPVVAA